MSTIPNAITAALITDPKIGKAPSIDETINGTTAARWYLVNTRDEVNSMFADGLPRIGDRWSDRLPRLRCVRRRQQPLTRAVDAKSGLCGRSVIECSYDTRQFDVAPYPGYAYTIVETAQSSRTVYYDARIDHGSYVKDPAEAECPENPQGPQCTFTGVQCAEPVPIAKIMIENGRGTTKYEGSTTVKVIDFPFVNELAGDRIATMAEYQAEQAVNLDQINTPPLRNVFDAEQRPIFLTFLPGTLQYADFSLTHENSYVKITHTLRFRQPVCGTDLSKCETAFDHVWRQRDSDGLLCESLNRSVLYRPKAFAGLWPEQSAPYHQGFLNGTQYL